MIALTIFAIGCIIVFSGHTESLIPLYAIGVFVPFTLALIGLARHYAFHWRMLIPCVAALLTATVVFTLVVTKFALIWPVLLFVPLIVVSCNKIKQHYEIVQLQLYTTPESENFSGQLVIVPISGLHASSRKALEIAQLQQQPVIAVYIGTTSEDVKQLQTQWQQQFPNIRLMAFTSSSQQLQIPLLRVIRKIKYIAARHHYHLLVYIPQLVVTKRWQHTLHNHHAFLLKQALLNDQRISVVSVSYKIEASN